MTLLDEGVLLALTNNAAARQEFPFLRLPPAPVTGCCGKSAGQRPQPDFNAMKAAAASLDKDAQRRLLALAGLGAARVLYYRDGRVVDATLGGT